RVEATQPADIYIINSCTVTAEADRQSRQIARKLKRQNENATVIMTGCYAQNNTQMVAGIDAIDWVVGNAAKLDIPHLILEQEGKSDSSRSIFRPDFDGSLAVPEDLLGGYEAQSRAFIQIQQGCDQACTFCIIHVARGPSVSFPMQIVLAQYRQIVAQGYKEVVICGVDLGSYGDDLGAGHSLAGLLREMLALDLDCRIRISSIDPWHLSDEIISLIAHNTQLCPQLHLSMQSANSLILKRMKRRADRELIFERVSRLREAIPGLVLSADVLVGFPTESQAQFADTLEAIEALQIAYPHVFPYSNREGAPAARIPRQITSDEKKRRARLVREMGKRVWEKQALSRILTTQRTIIESGGGASAVVARCDDYYPVKLRATQALLKGQWCTVKITGIEGQSLLGERQTSE
ncbi:MAG: tRNA (N(6)-L-threonylcarbamoyladenosine(37)-C(2))-methylthiotransferase MtaB, partial [Desulfobacterales bacterium]|nr:tRNA (N(6)-L-threonylcarbamoyladenosine(37)-C(2))-methylthiotransferase MtaB [Desulfobacterales bacterium]